MNNEDFKSIDRKDVVMSSEDFWFLARLRRRSRFEQPCNGAETKPQTKKTAVHRTISTSLQLLWKCSKFKPSRREAISGQRHSVDDARIGHRIWPAHLK